MAIERTRGKQMPYGFKGTVTVDGSVYQGAEIWLRDKTEGTVSAKVADKTHVFSDAVGRYLINLADCTKAYADADKVDVYCKIGDILVKTEKTILKARGYDTVDFTVTRLHGGVDGLKGSQLVTGKGGLHKQLTEGTTDGLV